MINKVMQEIIKLNHCAKSSADLSQIWAANEVLISKLGRNNSCHSLQRQPSFFFFFFFFPSPSFRIQPLMQIDPRLQKGGGWTSSINNRNPRIMKSAWHWMCFLGGSFWCQSRWQGDEQLAILRWQMAERDETVWKFIPSWYRWGNWGLDNGRVLECIGGRAGTLAS